MPYIVSLIIAAATSLVILLTRYEPDDSSIKIELERMKSMILVIDGFVDTYIQSGGDMSEINFQKLEEDGILPENIERNDPSEDSDNVKGNEKESTLTFPNSEVIWQLIPNIDDNTSYKILVDMTANSVLKSRAGFAKSFLGKEYCEKALFGEFKTNHNAYDESTEDFFIDETADEPADKTDAKFVCIIYK